MGPPVSLMVVMAQREVSPCGTFRSFVDLDGRDVLIAGGGEKALQKLRLLAKTTARIRVVAEEISADIVAAAQGPAVVLERRAFAPVRRRRRRHGRLPPTMIPTRTAAVAAAARAAAACRSTWSTRPRESTFIMPAIVDRDPVVVAIGTEGAAPILAREIKSKIEAGCRRASAAWRSAP